MRKIKQLFKGFDILFSAFSVISQNLSLARYIAVPLMINILLFGVGFFLLLSYRVEIIELIWAYPEESSFYVVLWYILGFFVMGVAMLVSYFLFTPIGCLIASPFNDSLSHAAEKVLDPESDLEEASLTPGEIFKAIRKELLKLFILCLILAAGLLFNVIPGIGTVISGAFTITFGAWFLSLEYLDYPMSRYGFTMKKMTLAVNRNLWLCLGFGAGAMVLLLIPLLNLVCIPVCVVGATDLFIRLRRDGLLPDLPAAAGGTQKGTV